MTSGVVISPVVVRKDWKSGIVFDYYDDTIDMFLKDSNDFLIYNFYTNNHYDQVFKCLWNNNGTPSTIEPVFEPGNYDQNNIFQSSDGYKWKYLYTIDIASKVNFMDSSWIPVPVKQYSSNPLKYSDVGYGNIDVINVTNGGSGYDIANSAININITGTNTNPASGYAVVNNGTITDIIVTSHGTDYISADVTISSSVGNGATAIAPVSPIGGHGTDPLSELGCHHIMITSVFNGSETDSSGINLIPTDITYYQLGLLANPTSLQTSPEIASAKTYKTSTDLIVAGGFGSFISDEIVYQGTTLETATFTATVLSFDPIANIIKTINTSGQISTNAPVFGSITNAARTLLSYNLPDLITLSGDVLYIDNRTGVQRSSDGIEQFKIVLNY